MIETEAKNWFEALTQFAKDGKDIYPPACWMGVALAASQADERERPFLEWCEIVGGFRQACIGRDELTAEEQKGLLWMAHQIGSAADFAMAIHETQERAQREPVTT